MPRTFSFVAAVLAVVFFAIPATADQATPEDAQAYVAKAVAMYEAEGQDATYAAINDPAGPFIKGDLYLFAVQFDGVMAAHGANKGLIGKNLMDLKDANGVFLIRALIDTAKTQGTGWVDYTWVNPVTKKIEPKSSFVQKIGDNLLFGAGIYRK